jgi:tRNA (guanine6-N2)-methyltransferase
MHDYYAMTIPGIETVAFSEIRARSVGAALVKFARGVVIFGAEAGPQDLLDLRTTEDVFVRLAHITDLGRGPDALRVLHSATSHSDLAGALALFRRAHHGAPPRTWRVVSQKEGTHIFRRMDAGQAVVDALRKALPKGMRQVDDDADVEIWLWLHGSEALIGVRLSDATMRHRTYKHAHLRASLRPTVAAAMAWLAQPQPADVVLDPMCGAGTLVIERARLAPLARATGGDLDPAAVALAEQNARAAGIRADWHTWDARDLPLDDASVTALLCNLPFGKQIGSLTTNVALYSALAREFRRVVAPAGRLVTLTSDDRLWDATLRESGWQIGKKIVVVVLGQPATIFTAHLP